MYLYIYISIFSSSVVGEESAQERQIRDPSNLPRKFQRFGFVNPFRAGGFSDVG